MTASQNFPPEGSLKGKKGGECVPIIVWLLVSKTPSYVLDADSAAHT